MSELLQASVPLTGKHRCGYKDPSPTVKLQRPIWEGAKLKQVFYLFCPETQNAALGRPHQTVMVIAFKSIHSGRVGKHNETRLF